MTNEASNNRGANPLHAGAVFSDRAHVGARQGGEVSHVDKVSGADIPGMTAEEKLAIAVKALTEILDDEHDASYKWSDSVGESDHYDGSGKRDIARAALSEIGVKP